VLNSDKELRVSTDIADFTYIFAISFE